MRDFRHHVAQVVAGQRQLGKHDQIGLPLLGGRDRVEVLGRVRGAIAERGSDLHKRHAQFGRLAGASCSGETRGSAACAIV